MENSKIYIPDSVKDSLTEIEKQFIQMRSSGLSINSIARQLKKSTHTISDWNKKYADIVLVGRNAEFCELQKKVIEFKLLRLNFLKSEVFRISEILSKIDVGGSNEEYEYEDLFEWFIKLCDLMISYESDLFKVGVNFKDNIFAETTAEKEDKKEKAENEEKQIQEKVDENTESNGIAAIAEPATDIAQDKQT